MKKVKWGFTLGSIIVLLVLIFVILYESLGMKYMLNAVFLINSTVNRDPESSYRLLSNKGYPSDIKHGILGRIASNKDKIKGIWVWDLYGVRFYKTDTITTYSYLSICDGQKWKNDGKVTKQTGVELTEWVKRVKPGNYIEINLSQRGTLGEITSFDWWVFVRPLPYEYFEHSCKH